MSAPFTHLRLHTEYSLVDSVVRIKPLVKAVAEAGMPAVAVTDQSNMFAMVKFYRAAMAAGLKPIIGVDMRVRNPDQPDQIPQGRQMDEASENPRAPGLWKGQLLHFGCLFTLLVIVTLAWNALGKPYPVAFWIAVAFPVLHQVWVWGAWRLELKSSLVSRSIGFAGYQVVFFLLFAGRFLSLAWLAFLDRGSLGFAPMATVLLTLLLLMPGLYAMYSVRRYFGMSRAAGGDHFDQSFRDMPMVREGIFRFTDNGMYVYAFLLFWAIATGFNSAAALTVAAFSHAYIWVHFHATERPDMEYLYGPVKS